MYSSSHDVNSLTPEMLILRKPLSSVGVSVQIGHTENLSKFLESQIFWLKWKILLNTWANVGEGR